MCAIYGVLTTANDRTLQPWEGDEMATILSRVKLLSRHRGRDAWNEQTFHLPGGGMVVMGWHRATPTPEAVSCMFQPYDGICHNGTIANDKELGGREGEIDSQVLPRVLKDRTGVAAIASQLQAVKGSYALAILGEGTVFLAANYKPLYYVRIGKSVFWASQEDYLVSDVCHRLQIAPRKVGPYGVVDLMTHQTARLDWECNDRHAVVVCSGGLDSTVVAAVLRREVDDLTLLHFRYGCRAEERELDRVARIAKALDAELRVMDMPAQAVSGSSLTTGEQGISGPVEGAEYAHEWVPARNLQMISLAVGYAESKGAGVVAFGGNLEESGAYPDNEQEFGVMLNKALPYATQNGVRVRLEMPVGNLMKHEIVKLGREVDAPFGLTWSCYHNGERHCGECGPCHMRKTAFGRNGMGDPVFP
jgi:7-cyano-7-deazaguanine synthase